MGELVGLIVFLLVAFYILKRRRRPEVQHQRMRFPTGVWSNDCIFCRSKSIYHRSTRVLEWRCRECGGEFSGEHVEEFLERTSFRCIDCNTRDLSKTFSKNEYHCNQCSCVITNIEFDTSREVYDTYQIYTRQLGT